MLNSGHTFTVTRRLVTPEDPEARSVVRFSAARPDFERLRNDLVRAVRRVCPAWLAGSRDDLVQAAMMRVMQVCEKSEGDHELKASYLYKVAHSALVDEIRRHRRRKETPLEDGEGGVSEVVSEAIDPERSARSGEIAGGIRECLAEMRRERRLAVTLHLQGHNVPETARILGFDVKRVDNLVYRGLGNLRDCLRARGLGP